MTRTIDPVLFRILRKTPLLLHTHVNEKIFIDTLGFLYTYFISSNRYVHTILYNIKNHLH